jgi:hypothetical protein
MHYLQRRPRWVLDHGGRGVWFSMGQKANAFGKLFQKNSMWWSADGLMETRRDMGKAW